MESDEQNVPMIQDDEVNHDEQNEIGPSHLIELIDDCKKETFQYLELSDLLSVAGSSKQFHPCLYEIFQRKFNKRRIVIGFENGNRNSITHPATTLQLLRIFGHLITDLHINFALFNTHVCGKIEQYLSEYCSKSLIFLSLKCNLNRPLFSCIEKPFENVYSIEMECSAFLQSKSPFASLFPRLRYIQIDSNRYEHRTSINSNRPSLESLAIFSEFDEQEIIDALKLNPQLRNLLLCSNYSSKLIRYLNECLPSLERLCLCNLPNEFFRFEFFDPIHFVNLVDFSMSVDCELSNKFPFTFAKLEQFTVVGSFKLNMHWFNLFKSLDECKSIGLFGVSNNIEPLFNMLLNYDVRYNVKNVSVSVNGKVSSECLNKLLRHTRVEKIALTSCPTDFDKFMRAIQFDSKWKVSQFAASQQFYAEKIKSDIPMLE